MNRVIGWILALAVTAASAAQRPEEFAYGARLEADGTEALYEVVLPAMVYRGVAQPDLSDVRVFNGRGEVVPYGWRARRTQNVESAAPVAVTLFPLKAEPGATVDGLTIRVQRGSGAAVAVEVASSGPGSGSQKRTVGYFVDLTGLSQVPRALELYWEPGAGFAGKLRVDGSDDLGSWRTLAAAAPLVDLEVAGQRLVQNRVELPQQKVRYLRLSWVAQGDGVQLPELTAGRAELATTFVEAPREWLSIESGPGDKPGEYVFDARGHFPVDRVRFSLPEPNTVAQVELLARNRTDQPWRQVARGVAYRLRKGAGEVVSPELTTGMATDRYWLLRVDDRGGGLGAGAPKLEIGWLPHQLVFAARGNAPFQLAYGNRNAKPAAYAIETLIPGYRPSEPDSIRSVTAGAEQKVNVQAAQALDQTELGGEARRQEVIDWKRWSLWGALVLGVAVLGIMAWRLARQLGGSAAPTSPDDKDRSG